MLTTKQVLAALHLANPEVPVTEDRVRSFIRRGRIPAPTIAAGRYLWRPDEVLALADALELNHPAPDALRKEAVS